MTCELRRRHRRVAQLASAEALRLEPGARVRLEVEPSPVLVVA